MVKIDDDDIITDENGDRWLEMPDGGYALIIEEWNNEDEDTIH